MGAAIMGDGEAVLILDLNEVLKTSLKKVATAMSREPGPYRNKETA